ncbi:MAG: TrmB family transcriptional regulator [Candidatus Hodarchaeota archaeon]
MFGLSNYESRAYLTLLSAGIGTAKEVSNGSKIPFGRVYDVLSSLENKGLVDKQESRPRKFIAKEPKVALNNLLAMKKAEVSSLTKKAISIEEKLSSLHKVMPEGSLFWSVALGESAIDQYIKKVSESEKEIQIIINIRVAARFPRKEVIKDLIKTLTLLSMNGVSVKVLLAGVAPKTLEEQYLTSIIPFFDVLEKAEVRHIQISTSAFDIIDKEKVIMKIMNPVKPDEFFALIFIWQKKLAMELKEKFQELWTNATDLKFEIA